MSTLSRTENKILMANARQALTGKWDVAIGGIAIYWLLPLVISFIPKAGNIISTILEGGLALGLAGFSMSLSREQLTKATDIFNERFWISLGAYLLQGIFILLWSLLLIIPGIIAAYSYALTNYILVEDKTIGIQEAIQKSKDMMRGNKWKLACLQGRFIGWGILCLFTLGIGFLWLYPYVIVSIAEFYDDIKRDLVTADAAQI